MRSVAPLVLLTVAAAAFAVVAAPSCVKVESHTQAAACAAALNCYFKPPAHDLGKFIPAFKDLDPKLFDSTYGPTGSCWNGDLEVAHACEDRCRALLWQDCNLPYNFDGGPADAPPFCGEACLYAEECSNNGKGPSLCPSGLDGGFLDAGTDAAGKGHNIFVEAEIATPFCDAKQPEPGAPKNFGCCVLPQHDFPPPIPVVPGKDAGPCDYEYESHE